MHRKLILVLIVVFVAVSALALHSAEKREVKRIRHIEIRKNAGSADFMPARLMQLFKFADELELSNPQLLQLRMVFQKQAESHKKNMQNSKQFKKLNDCNISEEEVRKLASEKAKQLEESIIAKFRMQQEIKKIFTPEQLKKLEELKARKPARKGMPFMKGGKMGHPKMPFWNKAGKDRQGPPARWRNMPGRKAGKPGVPKPARRQQKDSPESMIDAIEEIFDVDQWR
jgi:Spy/CpxP family protein refolding chaperone